MLAAFRKQLSNSNKVNTRIEQVYIRVAERLLQNCIIDVGGFIRLAFQTWTIRYPNILLSNTLMDKYLETAKTMLEQFERNAFFYLKTVVRERSTNERENSSCFAVRQAIEEMNNPVLRLFAYKFFTIACPKPLDVELAQLSYALWSYPYHATEIGKVIYFSLYDHLCDFTRNDIMEVFYAEDQQGIDSICDYRSIKR